MSRPRPPGFTVEQLLAIPEVPDPCRAVWREEADPVLIWMPNGEAWSTFRLRGALLRYRVPREDRAVDPLQQWPDR